VEFIKSDSEKYFFEIKHAGASPALLTAPSGMYVHSFITGNSLFNDQLR
jgi:hypothetical protein